MGWGGDLCMVQSDQPSDPGCAPLAAPRMHYLADSGECTTPHPWGMVLPRCGDQRLRAEPREPCWDWGGVGRGRSPVLCQGRAGGKKILKGVIGMEEGGLPWERNTLGGVGKETEPGEFGAGQK